VTVVYQERKGDSGALGVVYDRVSELPELKSLVMVKALRILPHA